MYNLGLEGLSGLVLPSEPDEPGTIHARHLFTVMVDSTETGIARDNLVQRLEKLNIGTGVHYIALHLHKFYRETFGYQPDDFPNANWISERTLSLPLTAKMTNADAEDVIAAVRWILGHD